jgi:hypothetical protein
MSIVLPFAEKFAGEEVSGDMLFPRSLATTGICAYSRKSTVVHYLKMSCEIAVFSDRSVQSAQKSFLQSLRLIRPMFALVH